MVKSVCNNILRFFKILIKIIYKSNTLYISKLKIQLFLSLINKGKQQVILLLFNPYKHKELDMDTIVTAINFANVKINDYSKFTANPMNLHYPVGSDVPTVSKIFRSKRNNSPGEFSEFGYLPQVSIIIYPGQGFVYLTFSVSKMLFNGSNLYEVKESDFDDLVAILRYKLECIDIDISTEHLKTAIVWACHFSKNIVLDKNHLGCNTILSILNKMNNSRKLTIQNTTYWKQDISKINFNEGRMVSLWSTKHEFVAYNKYCELDKDEYGKKELLQTKCLTDNNFIRLEYRIFKTPKLRQILNNCGIQSNNITFQDIFKDDVMKSVITYAWKSFIKPKLDILNILEEYPTPMILFDKLDKMNITGTSKLNIMAAYYVYHEENGLQTLSHLFPPRTNVLPRIRYNIRKMDETGWNVCSTFEYIEQILENNIPLRPGTL